MIDPATFIRIIRVGNVIYQIEENDPRTLHRRWFTWPAYLTFARWIHKLTTKKKI